MNSNKNSPHFSCTQSELYSVCRIGWLSFQNQLAVFSAKKPFYNPDFATAMLAEIDATQAMADRQARGEISESLRINLMDAAEACRVQWQLLKSYIISAYPIAFHKSKTDAAGAKYYEFAKRNIWENIRSLCVAGNTFIMTNEAELAANNNMPASFPAEYKASMQGFSDNYDQFKMAAGGLKPDTEQKRKANNKIYDKTLAMFKDGQLYFKNDPALRQQFIFHHVLELVSGTDNAGFKGTLRDSVNNAGISNVKLSLFTGTDMAAEARYTALSNEAGEYDFGSIANGNYTLKIEADGYLMKTEEVVISVGVSSKRDLVMVKA